MGHPNADLIRRGYAAFAAKDMDTLGSLFADDATWHSSGTASPFAGDFKGRGEIFEMFARIPESLDRMEQDLHDVVANDEHTIVLVTSHVERNGRRAELQGVHIWHVEDGKATETWIIDAEPAKAAAFWSD